MPRRKSTPNTNNDPAVLFQPIGTEQQHEPSLEDRLSALGSTVENLSKQLSDGASREERLQNLVVQLAAGRNQMPQAQHAQRPVAIDFSKLPDPEKDPEGFRRGLSDQTNAAIASAVQAQIAPAQQAQDRAQRLESMWKNFQDKYKDLAPFRDIAETVAASMVREGVAGGMTAEQVVFTDQDSFLKKVASKMQERIDAIRGPAGGDDEGDDGEGDDDSRPAPQRTLGIAGATPSGQGGKKTADKPGNLVDELKEMQKGIYW